MHVQKSLWKCSNLHHPLPNPYYICRLEWGRCKFFSRKIKEYVRLKFGEKTIKCILQSKCLSNLQLVVHLLNLFSCAPIRERLVIFFLLNQDPFQMFFLLLCGSCESPDHLSLRCCGVQFIMLLPFSFHKDFGVSSVEWNNRSFYWFIFSCSF